MALKFKLGDLVILKDGSGPMMEVRGNGVRSTPFGVQLDRDKYMCIFIFNGRRKKKEFDEHELLFVPEGYR